MPQSHSSCQSRISQLHDCAFAAGSGLTRVLGPLHLGNHQLKGLLYVLVVACAGFGPRAFELCGEGAAVFGCDLALFGAEVGFVAYDDEGHPVDGLLEYPQYGFVGVEWTTYEVVQDLIANDTRHFEALLAGDGVDNHVAMDADEMLRVEDTIFILQYDTSISDGFLRNSLSSSVQMRKEGLLDWDGG
jgi:hypothetical protein